MSATTSNDDSEKKMCFTCGANEVTGTGFERCITCLKKERDKAKKKLLTTFNLEQLNLFEEYRKAVKACVSIALS